MKYSFSSDYNEICAPEILEYMIAVRNEQFNGYSVDRINESAKEKIKKLIGCNCDVHFLVGGTQANTIVISHALNPYQAVVAVDSGHINVHETGAIESTGHKVCVAEGNEGKLTAEGLEKVILSHTDEHMVMPKMAYISDATEIGSIYTKEELVKIRSVCDKYGLYLFLDGARLGAALASEENNLSLADIAKLTDVFYIGATKNGGMLGEAVVITNDKLKENFRYSIKQRGAMMAKGFILGIQFDCLFTDDLFFRLAKKENEAAQYLQNELSNMGVKLMIKSSTNQIFPIFSNEVVKRLQNDYIFNIWSSGEKESVIRLVTNFNVDINKINEFLNDVRAQIK